MGVQNVFLLFCGILLISSNAGLDITIDTLEDLREVESVVTACEYVEDQTDLCKEGTPDVETNKGFWSSCKERSCNISIELGKVGGLGRVPEVVNLLTSVVGTVAQIRLDWKDSFGIVNRLPPVPKSQDEETPEWLYSNSYYNISSIQDLTPESIILIRLSSSQLNSSIDVLDKIIFHFSEQATEPTTIASTLSDLSSTSSTQTSESDPPRSESTTESDSPGVESSDYPSSIPSDSPSSVPTNPPDSTPTDSSTPVPETTPSKGNWFKSSNIWFNLFILSLILTWS